MVIILTDQEDLRQIDIVNPLEEEMTYQHQEATPRHHITSEESQADPMDVHIATLFLYKSNIQEAIRKIFAGKTPRQLFNKT